MDRAYSLLTITKADADQRIVEGIASTPQVDLVGDVVEPRGGHWKMPVPFLHQHDHAAPVGWVEHLEAKADALHFRARLAKIAEPGKLRDRLELVWDEIRTGLLRGVSIGFSATKAEPIATGVRFIEWTLHEISAVTIPANTAASIQTVKQCDQAALAKARPTRVVRLDTPVGRKPVPVVKLNNLPTSGSSDRPIADAIRKEMDRQQELAEEAQRRKDLGPGTAMTIALMAAGTKATDAELAELRRRLDQLERGGGHK